MTGFIIQETRLIRWRGKIGNITRREGGICQGGGAGREEEGGMNEIMHKGKFASNNMRMMENEKQEEHKEEEWNRRLKQRI